MHELFCRRLSPSPSSLPSRTLCRRTRQVRLILAERCIWNKGCLRTTNRRHPRWILAEPTGHVERTHRDQEQQIYGQEDNMRHSAVGTLSLVSPHLLLLISRSICRYPDFLARLISPPSGRPCLQSPLTLICACDRCIQILIRITSFRRILGERRQQRHCRHAVMSMRCSSLAEQYPRRDISSGHDHSRSQAILSGVKRLPKLLELVSQLEGDTQQSDGRKDVLYTKE